MDLRRVVVNTISAVANKFIPFSGPVTQELLSDVLQYQDEQLTVLKDIQRSLQDFMNGPWQTARMYIQEAALPGRETEQIRRSLIKAGVPRTLEAA